ncbi:MAG TPA: S41 family peptidase [Terracidiphilus sp.]|nr:S41 family peptidase [Terracidiphilus sp.]
MSERVFAFLLRLYPAAFREKYRDEALQLYRDRLQDETGTFLRARLYFDLLEDAAKGLPQAWRNSYAENPAPSLAPNAEGTPSFRMLEKEKLRPESIAIGSTLSLLALLAFGLLLSLPSPFRPLPNSGGPKSPIEAVLERLNRAPSPQTDGIATPASTPATTPAASGAIAARSQSGAAAIPVDAALNIDPAERDRVVKAVAGNLRAHYYDRDKAQNASAALLALEERGAYDAIVDGPDLAARLTSDIRSSTQDLHLIVEYSSRTLPAQPGPPSAAPSAAVLEQYREAMKQQNCTFEKVQILPNRIGYFKLNAFPDPEICGAEARASLQHLNQSDAIIFDLRDNGGGDPDMVAQMSAPLFNHPVPWFNPRANPSSTMLSPAPGSRLANKPVYILTSSLTLSGAEQFTYNLKMLKRATIVGENTGGSAHLGVFHRIDDHFGMGIVESPITNPYGRPDWELIGVAPDVKVPAADALATAEKLALEHRKK